MLHNGNKETQSTLRGWSKYAADKSKMEDGHLVEKNRKITIYTQGLTDFAQSGILYTEWVIRDKFRKSKMGMATILIKNIESQQRQPFYRF